MPNLLNLTHKTFRFGKRRPDTEHLLGGSADTAGWTEFAPDSPLEEAVRSELVSKMGFRNNARFRGAYSTVTGGKGAGLGRMGGVSLNRAASRSLRFGFKAL
jgi:hypothetical protein